MEKIQNAFLSGVSRKVRVATLSFVFAFLFLGFQASAQQYVPTEDAIEMLGEAANEIQFSDFNWSAPTSTGIALAHPAQLKKAYYEAVQVNIKTTNDVAQGIAAGETAFNERFPQQAPQWASQFRADAEALLAE